MLFISRRRGGGCEYVRAFAQDNCRISLAEVSGEYVATQPGSQK